MTISKYQLKHLKKTIKKIKRNDSSATEVVLNGFDFQSDNTLATLAMAIMNNAYVKILYLHGCNITAKGAYLLAFALRSNKSIEHVWLNDNKIGSTGADALASALCFNRTLLTLGLRNNSIGNRGGKALLRAVNENCTIVGLFLEGNRMSSRIVNEINRITSDEPSESDHESDDEYEVEVYEHHDAYDDETVTGSVVSRSFAAKTLGAIKEVDESYHSEVDESVCSDDVDFDFSTCFQQKETKGRLAKLKEMAISRFMKRKVRPSPLK
ncbi:leucine-rich repeat protein [Skeletonema marinoi]|uniref:Leucine-rich repeat protein n=1 Tax=Skeletonema marinoi TaxID=267567 RepID=A0AAD8YJV9_9STRA|nr:leucine-rich repeat protein [Skeletonema marinoi]